MTVKELIKILEKYPQDIDVLGANEHGNYDLEEENIFYWNNEEDVKKYGEEPYECVTIG